MLATQLLQQQGASLPDATVQAHGLIYGTLLKQSTMLAFADVFWVMALLFLVILPLMFFIQKVGPVQGPR